MTPTVFIPVRAFGHLVGGAFILTVAHRISLKQNVSIARQFALTKPLIPKWQVLILGISSLAVAFLAGKLAKAMFGMPEVELRAQSFFEQLTPVAAVFHVLVTGLFPGFFEEITFRGFFQGHLSKRVGVPVSILIMAITFGLVHIAPYGIVLSTLMGIWLGIIAWRIGSVWPTIMGHFIVNAFNSFYMSGKHVWGFPETPPFILQWVIGITSFAAMLVSIAILLKPTRYQEQMNYSK
ncbi:MAG: CPBP family intramembrane glutamic endopeptidase [Bacteroidota bacterium]